MPRRPGEPEYPSTKAANRRRYWRRMALLDEIKLARGCVDCYRAHAVALDFDHRDRADKREGWKFGANVLRRWEDVLAEVAKCDVRCANCHRVKTRREDETRPVDRPSPPRPPGPPSLF